MELSSFDCDSVACMEEMGVRSGEILQYARAVMTRRDIEALIRGLEELTRKPSLQAGWPEDMSDCFVSPVADAVSEHAS
jgi:hypothetical protein